MRSIQLCNIQNTSIVLSHSKKKNGNKSKLLLIIPSTYYSIPCFPIRIILFFSTLYSIFIICNFYQFATVGGDRRHKHRVINNKRRTKIHSNLRAKLLQYRRIDLVIQSAPFLKSRRNFEPKWRVRRWFFKAVFSV